MSAADVSTALGRLIGFGQADVIDDPKVSLSELNVSDVLDQKGVHSGPFP